MPQPTRQPALRKAGTCGARPGRGIGDVSTLWALDEGLRRQAIPAAIDRGAYSMTNWLGLAGTVRESGVLPSLFPGDTELPMVAPADLGRAAVARLLSPMGDTDVRHVEGPARNTPQDVADAFAVTLDRDVAADVAPRARWAAIHKGLGFPDRAARAYARMTAASIEDGFVDPAPAGRGRVTLGTFLAQALNG